MSLKEFIKQLQKREHITQDELCRRLGFSRNAIESAPAEIKVAIKLAFGTNNICANKFSDSCKKFKEQEKILSWVRKFPIRALQNMGLIRTNIKDAELIREVFRFMQIGSIDGFNNYYSTTLQSANPQTYAAWIRLGELRIKRLTTDFTPNREAVISNLKFLRTNVFIHKQNLRNIAREVLNNCGIELIEVEPFLTAPTPTCAFYWRGYQPVIQFPTTKMDDSRFLEALFHAVAHILYHPLRTSCLQIDTLTQPTIQNNDTVTKDFKEIEAETFAQDILLSEAEECELICCGRFNERRCLQHFSGQFHVRPSILVERLQQQGKIHRHSLLNDFKIAV